VLRGDGDEVVIREVDGDLDLRQQTHQSVPQGPDSLRESALELAQGCLGGSIAPGANQVADGLSLAQIEPSVEEGPFGELAGLRRPRPKPVEQLKHAADRDLAGVAPDLRHGLAREARAGGKQRDDDLVDLAAGCGVDQAPVVGVPPAQRPR